MGFREGQYEISLGYSREERFEKRTFEKFITLSSHFGYRRVQQDESEH